MLTFPNAKINIGLRVLEKRPDGFHNIETLFCPVSLCDVLEFVPEYGSQAEDVSITVTGGMDTGENTDNLCVKAYNLIKKDFDIPPVKIHLHKVIPVGAGLGGGSSDAAFTLKGLNNLFNLGINEEGLISYAMQLGSDCPFFIRNTPMIGCGRGEILENAGFFPAGLHVVIVNPGIHISTAEAYGGVNPDSSGISLKEMANMPVAGWRKNIFNAFEKSIFKKYPLIEKLKGMMYESGALYASMTGSGSSVYGLFGGRPEVCDKFRGYFCHTGWVIPNRETYIW